MTIFSMASRFKNTHDKLLSESLTSLLIKEKTGFTDCPACVYDEQLRASSKPNCTTCSGKGRIPTYSNHTEKVVPVWLTSDNMNEKEVGVMAIGDCKIMARYETLGWFQNCLDNKTTLTVDSINVVIKRIIPGLFQTSVLVYCSRTTL